MNSTANSNAARNERAFRLIGYGLMFLMLVCVALAVGSLIQNLMPEWHSSVIAGLLLLVVIDQLFTYQYFKSLTPLSAEWASSLAAQWIVFVVFIRLLLSYANGAGALAADLSRFARGDLASFFSGEFVITLLLAVPAWNLPAQFLGLLNEIGLDQRLALREDQGFVPVDEAPAHQRLVSLVFSLGIGLVILTALARLNLRSTITTLDNLADFAHLKLEQFSAGEAGVLLYFLFGLALLAQSRLMSLQTRWNRQRIAISSSNLNRQWAIHSLVFLLLLAFVVSLLPAGDSLGFLSLLGTLLSFLLRVFVFIAELIVALVLLLFSLPFLLFGKAPPVLGVTPPPVLPTVPVQPATPPAPSPLWALMRSILLWGSLVVIIIFSLTRFIRQHGGLSAALGGARAANWFVLVWQWLSRNLDRTRGGLSLIVANGWQAIITRLEGKRIMPPANWINLSRLDPRRQVYFFYLAMLRRGGEQGLTRKLSQTPSEYAATLEQAVPAADEDIASLTDAFVEARYSRQPVDAGKANRVKIAWGRIRRALQSRSKARDA